MDHAKKIRCILNNLTSPLYEDNPFSTSRREPENQCDGDYRGLTFQAFYNRVSTFGIKNWGSDPNAALYLAKYGFQNVSGFKVKCCSCSITVDLEVFLGKRDILATIATQSHKSTCRWLHLSTPGEYFRIPRNPVKAYEDFLEKVKNLLTFSNAIPKIKAHVLSEEVLLATKEENHASDLNSSAIVSAACMAVCGWEKSSESIFHCRFCHRKCGIWSYVSVQNSVLGETLPRKTPNRVVSLIIEHINRKEMQDMESGKTNENTAQHGEGLCSSESPLGSTDKSESSSSDETDETNNVQVRRRLHSRSFFNAQTRKRNALKILRRKAALSQKWRTKTPTSSGGDSGPEEQGNSEVKVTEQRNSYASGESDQSVIVVPRNDSRVNSRKKLMSENSTVQHNGYSVIGFSKDFHISKSDSDEVMNCDSEEGLPLVKSNILKTDRQVELVPTNNDTSKENDCVMPKIEFGASCLEEDDHSAKNNKEYNPPVGSTYEIKGVHSHGTICVSDSASGNVPNRELKEIAYPQYEQNGESTDTDCIVINSTTSRCTSDEDDNLIRSTATTDARSSENCSYAGASNIQQNDVNKCPRTPTWEERQSKMNNKPKITLSLEERQYNANNNNHSSHEPMTIEEHEYDESYNEDSVHEEAYTDGHNNDGLYNEENQLSLVISSVVGNAVIPCDSVEDQMEVCSSPPKDKELSDGSIILSDSSSKPDDSKISCICKIGAVCCCATSRSESEYYQCIDKENTPRATTIMCNKLVYPCCLKKKYYELYYSEYPTCSNSGYHRFNYSGYPHHQCNCSGYTSCLGKQDNQCNVADNPLSFETEFNQGNNSENAVISEGECHQSNNLKNAVSSENECCKENGHCSQDSCQLDGNTEIKGRDSSGEKVVKRKRQHSPVDEMREPKKKKAVTEDIKVYFDPLLEHRYWCMWKLKTEDPTGVSGQEKAGWEFHMDAIKEGYRLKAKGNQRLSYNEERDRFFQCLEAISNLGLNFK